MDDAQFAELAARISNDTGPYAAHLYRLERDRFGWNRLTL
jgi:hypothetical protein